MLRIALILALLAAGGALVVTQFVVKDKVVALNDDLTSTKSTLATTTDERNKAQTEAKSAKAAAEATAKELASTKTERDTAQEEATKQTARADKLNSDLTTVTKARNEAQQELAQWQALNIKPDQVRVVQAELKKTTEQRDELQVLKKGVEKMLARTEAELRKYKGDDTVVEMPGLKGTVVSADSQWNFVVLDVGENGGAKPGGIVMVRRGDKLVGKARIMTVEANRSIANLLPGWKQGDVAVAAGDVVLY